MNVVMHEDYLRSFFKGRMSYLNGSLYSSHPAYSSSIAGTFAGCCSSRDEFVQALDTAWSMEPHSFCPDYALDVIEDNMNGHNSHIYKNSDSPNQTINSERNNLGDDYFFNFEDSKMMEQDTCDENFVEGVHSIKAFTKLCNLSTPTVMKWLDGHQVYKSSAAKILQALAQSKITKQDLLHMRRMARKRKPEDPIHLSKVNPLQNSIKFIISHKILLNDANFGGEIQYQVVLDDLSTNWVTKADIKTDFETKLLINYWEDLNNGFNKDVV